MKKILVVFTVFCVALLSACHKTEFMPPAEGEAILYEDPRYENLATVLQQSPYQLFYKVWMKSSLTTLLSDRKPYTLLVPDDAAMLEGGYTEAKIASMTMAEADKMVRYYTTDQRITQHNIEESMGNTRVMSILEKPQWRITQPYAYDQRMVNFRYLHFLGREGDQFMVNGIALGQLDASIPASNGYIWPIQKLVSLVDKSFWEVMESDPRFSMFVQARQEADIAHDLNVADFFINHPDLGFDPGPRMDYLRQYYEMMPLGPNSSGFIVANTIFLPTNEAFQQAGFSTIDDIIAWNASRRAPVDLNFDTFEVLGGGTPTDTILNYHYEWGRENLPYNGMWGKAPDPLPTVFYQNDLRNELLENVSINNRRGEMQYIMPFTFGRDAQGRAQVQLKGSTAAPATVIETINTAMGPLHVVDRLFVPQDFKMK